MADVDVTDVGVGAGAAVAPVAAELYALPPEQFTAARNERAKACRGAGNRELAAQIAALRKPSAAAWVVNQLARRRRAELDQLIDLGATMRAAHLDLSAQRLRALSDQRHRVVAALAGAGSALAAEQGHPVSAAVVQEVVQTLEAAFADPTAADAVGSGQLLGALSYAGLGDSGGGTADTALHRRPSGVGTEERGHRNDRDLAAAQAQAAAAEHRADEANRHLDQMAEHVAATLRRHDDAQTRVEELREELRVVQEELVTAAAELRRGQRARDEATRRADTAVREAEYARARVQGLRQDRS